jgi:hypothetical protein
VLLVLLLPNVYKGVAWDNARGCFSLGACSGEIDLCQYSEQISKSNLLPLC